jgi:hypothetical protein
MKTVYRPFYLMSKIWTDYFGQLGVGFKSMGIHKKAISFERDTLRPSSNIDIFAVEMADYIGTTKL